MPLSCRPIYVSGSPCPLVTEIPQQARHMRIRHLRAHARLLDLLLGHLGRHDHRRRFVRRRQQMLFQVLDRRRRLNQANLVPNILELLVKFHVQAGIIGPYHLWRLVLFVPCDQQLMLPLHLVDVLLHVGPALFELLDAETMRGALRLEVCEELDRVADVMERAEAVGAFAVEACRVVAYFGVRLQNLGYVSLPLGFAVLDREIVEQVVQGQRHSLVLEMGDSICDVGRKGCADSRICWLGVDNIGRFRAFALEIRRCSGLRRRWRGPT